MRVDRECGSERERETERDRKREGEGNNIDKYIPYSRKFSQDKIIADAGLLCRTRPQLCLICGFYFRVC